MSGGGTGGHIYPAIAIADEIRRRHPDAEILFVGTERGMERDIVPKNGYPIRYITVSGFDRRHLTKNFKTLKDLRQGMKEARRIIREFKPDYVIGTGGYVCGPVVRSAYRLGVPAFIHEQNAFPGLTNKLLSRHVKQVFLAFEDAAEYFKTSAPPLAVGNPVRSAFQEASREESRKKLGLSDDDFVILGFGGSLGAQCINEQMQQIAERFAGRENTHVFFATGKRYYPGIMEQPHTATDNITYLEYINDMPLYLSACDIAITRSGALTVSEITACGRASVMIPSPNVTANHQFFNAKYAADRGACILLEEKDLAETPAVDAVEELYRDPRKVRRMEEAAAAAGRTDAAEVICRTIGI